MKYLILFLLPCLMLVGLPVYHAPAEAEHVSYLKKDAKKLCEYYRQRVLKGESMASIAKLYSEDPGSAPNGGQYDGVVPGMMVAGFEKVAYSLKPGEISEVFETPFGFHFIQLISRKGDTLSLRHLLITRD
jgi:peptidyl-prolyl cis-trans isomerase SurA